MLSLLSDLMIGLKGAPNKVSGQNNCTVHIQAGIDWIKAAHKAAGDGGISKGYDLLRGKWAPSYPETTGYTVPTLLNASLVVNESRLYDLAISLADYLLKCSTPEGGVLHWEYRAGREPVVFDTGQVMFGWLAAYQASRDERYLQAAQTAGEWLVRIQDSSGSWKLNQHLGIEKVIDTRVAWALLLLNQINRSEALVQAVRQNLDWACSQQHENGWFAKCSFRPQDDPFTHTLAYTAEGLLECGLILDEPGYIIPARLMADALLSSLRPNGSLASTYEQTWRETNSSSCLTGNCQIGHLWLKFYRLTKDFHYLEAAQKIITFMTGRQNIETQRSHIHGGIPGSAPIYGLYERFKYPNWPVKFFIDLLLDYERIQTGKVGLIYRG